MPTIPSHNNLSGLRVGNVRRDFGVFAGFCAADDVAGFCVIFAVFVDFVGRFFAPFFFFTETAALFLGADCFLAAVFGEDFLGITARNRLIKTYQHFCEGAQYAVRAADAC